MRGGMMALGPRSLLSDSTIPRANTSPICWKCQASSFSRPQQAPSPRRRFSTTRTRHAKSTKPETYYDFFRDALPKGPPPHGPFTVNAKSLRKEFLQLQATAHPDRHPQDMKTRAEALSSRINEAYRTLQDPLLRTQYLLSLRGIDVAEDETAKVEDQDLLMQVLESQEEIEGAQEERDLKALEQTNDERLEESVKRLEKAFEEDDVETAKVEAVRLRYWTNVKEGIKAWEPGKEVRLVH